MIARPKSPITSRKARMRARSSDTEKLEQRNRELSILNEIAQALNREVDLDRALHAVLAQVASLLNLHTGWVFLMDDATGKMYLAATHNLPPALANKPQRMEGTCYCLDTYREGDLDGAANVNVITCSRLNGLVDGTDGLRYHSSIPLYAHGKPLGVLNVASTDWRELSADDLRLLYTVGDLLSISIERARLFTRSTQIGAVEERNRLAREIHDTLAQGLAATTMQLETADVLLEKGDSLERAQQAVQHALALTRANLEEARRSVLDLRAAPLEGRTLAEALSTLAEEHASKWNVPTQVEVIGGSRPLPVRVEAGLYRVAQEALTNVVRHAQATALTIQLVLTPERVTLTIEDDGRGFEPSQIPKDRFGLLGLNERVKLLGGQLKLRSQPGAGTRLEVTIPL
ncbi:MAG: GAF domain-containing sensor histidine kinase [Chloroflexi bacterium]|nr:GAF domain-containing sensor histidine kinase [Chloroflexota bacterium]